MDTVPTDCVLYAIIHRDCGHEYQFIVHHNERGGRQPKCPQFDANTNDTNLTDSEKAVAMDLCLSIKMQYSVRTGECGWCDQATVGSWRSEWPSFRSRSGPTGELTPDLIAQRVQRVKALVAIQEANMKARLHVDWLRGMDAYRSREIATNVPQDERIVIYNPSGRNDEVFRLFPTQDSLPEELPICQICQTSLHRTENLLPDYWSQPCTLNANCPPADTPHAFHIECIRQWFEAGNPNCPLCRSGIIGRVVKVPTFEHINHGRFSVEPLIGIIDPNFVDLGL